ncbi:hypothetical protein BJ742DRAFT_829235 [Cladochytrium replicatum]|nr:hypothetical protein BJ742DRAFT_829235 [Cladochytrium replicatum]
MTLTVVWYDKKVFNRENASYYDRFLVETPTCRFSDESKAVNFLKSSVQANLVISSGSAGQSFCAKIASVTSIYAVIIFCSDESRHRHWAAREPRITLVISSGWGEVQNEIDRLSSEYTKALFRERELQRLSRQISFPETLFSPGEQQQHSRPRYDVMLSYNHSYQSLVRELVGQLLESGVEVWVDYYKMAGNLKNSMHDGVRDSRVFVPFVCGAYCQSQSCMFEFRLAVAAKVVMAPVWIDGETLSPEVKDRVDRDLWIAVGGDDRSIEEQARTIKDSLLRTLLRAGR